LLAGILAAQSDLAAALAQLSSTGDNALRAQVAAQLQTLAGLERAVTSGNPAMLASVRREVASAIAAGANISQQVRDDAQRTAAAELAAVSAVSRQQVQSLMRDMHRFDPFLRFASPEDEEAYRRREAERRAYIEEQHRRGTPEGDLNASAGAIGQMVDARAHGAGDSPEFQQRWNELVGTTQRLREQVQRSGGSTREFDQRLRAELRQTLRARGASAAEIEARLAAHPDNPLEAVRDYMRDAADIRQVEQSASLASRQVSQIVAAEEPTEDRTLSDAIARLRAAGATAAANHPDAERFAHGVNANEHPAPPAWSVTLRLALLISLA
jgi:hypothetical protein